MAYWWGLIAVAALASIGCMVSAASSDTRLLSLVVALAFAACITMAALRLNAVSVMADYGCCAPIHQLPTEFNVRWFGQVDFLLAPVNDDQDVLDLLLLQLLDLNSQSFGIRREHASFGFGCQLTAQPL